MSFFTLLRAIPFGFRIMEHGPDIGTASKRSEIVTNKKVKLEDVEMWFNPMGNRGLGGLSQPSLT